MKKLITILILMIGLSFAYAELIVDIPFDLDIVGEDFSANGPYEYESDWITITNTSGSNQDYTFQYSNENLPTGWTMSLCNDIGTCYMPNLPVPFDLSAGESVQIHIIINVNSTDSFDFSLTFDEGDLTEPMVFDFTFRTEDYVNSAEHGIQVPEKLSQNYPNPFNPSSAGRSPNTIISYSLTPDELTEASLIIFNAKGQKIRTYNDLDTNGQIVWNGKDDKNNIVNSGVYYYKLDSIKTSKIKKMILLK